MSLMRLIRTLGVRRGFRWWWRQRLAAAVLSEDVRTPVTLHHGAKPSMPGYRRKETR